MGNDKASARRLTKNQQAGPKSAASGGARRRNDDEGQGIRSRNIRNLTLPAGSYLAIDTADKTSGVLMFWFTTQELATSQRWTCVDDYWHYLFSHCISSV
jgi:hypothetical protein